MNLRRASATAGRRFPGRKLSPSVAVFTEGGAGARNATLFAKVFLEESRSGAEAHEAGGAWG